MTPPAQKPHNGGCVKWAPFLTLLGIALVTAVAINTFVWAQHGRTMDQFEKRMCERFDEVKGRLNKIDTSIEKMRNGK